MSRLPTKAQKPKRFGKYLVGERYKSLGRYLQLKFGRRLLLEVKIPNTGLFEDAEAYRTLARQAREWHSEKWEPTSKKRIRAPRMETGDLFGIQNYLQFIKKPEAPPLATVESQPEPEDRQF